jgi:hypothetical protein
VFLAYIIYAGLKNLVVKPVPFYAAIRILIMAKHKKLHLPEKDCLVCGRPFTWRKKWEAVWDEVKYCSKRCRSERTTRS